MTQLEYEVSFTTPAFLGNADQQAQWRTPPFKALIRQWWRVVHAREVDFDASRLRAAENELFGFASEDGAARSQLRLRLASWEAGSLRKWPDGAKKKIEHPEVDFPVGSELYLGFGPLEYDKPTKGTKLGISKSSQQQRSAIKENSPVRLSLRCPRARCGQIEETMRFVSWFGTLGSRSRNGWGALRVVAAESTSPIRPLSAAELKEAVRPLDAALKLDWPHAIGASEDGRPLVWLTPKRANWHDVMQDLAEAKIKFRTRFPFKTGKVDAQIEDRHVLAYPVTNHLPKEWGVKKRLANQIRFKVFSVDGGLRGLIVHLPCKMPSEFSLPAPIASRQTQIWSNVHAVLDAMKPNLDRLS